MKATVLVDNVGECNLSGEWGLSIYIENKDKNILLDAGSSKLFLKNGEALGKSIKDVDYAVLSHAHYDHANGMKAFFDTNKRAKFILRDGSGENCYLKKWIFHKYIGLPKNILTEYPERIAYAKDDYCVTEGVWLIPHKTSGLSEVGRKNSMYIRDGKFIPDDFSHEQSLVIDTEDGLVVFNSCSHGGADNIINEIKKTFPDKKIYALVGGFHIFSQSKDQVRALAKRIRETGIEKVYTGHCTGKKSFAVLHEELGDMVQMLHVGLEITAGEN